MANHATAGMVRSNDLSKAENCEQKLELHIKVENLRNMDWIGQSDPFAVVYLNSEASGISPRVPEALPHAQGLRGVYGRARSALGTSGLLPNGTRRHPPRTAPWERIGKTEVVRNSLSASFTKTIPLTYFFERSQMIAVDVYDADSLSSNLLHHDYLGSAEISVPKIVRADGMCYKAKLSIANAPGASLGFVTVIAENKATRREMVKMDIGVSISARPTLMSRFLGPFLVISRQAPGRNAWVPIYRSPTAGRHNAARGRYAYDFEKISQPWDRLSLGSRDTRLRWEVVFSVRSRDRVAGAAVLSFREWQDVGMRVPLAKPSAAGRTGGERFSFNALSRGEMELRNFVVQSQPLFIDYVMGGCEMSLVIGVDFTASNGDSMQPSSLHFCDQYRPNEYELAIRAVGDILAKYDSDNRFPGYGFGARLPPDFDAAQHCFSLTGATDPTCYKIDGVLDAYRQSLYNVRLSGPTEFGLLIRTAAQHAQSEAGLYPQAYTILLIVTDGVINDFDETTRAIVEASHLPLSIVIIGVGDADFTAMDALDGDDVPLCRKKCRDIVQFVPFRKYQGKPDVLVSKVLEEIPNQLVEYMMSKNILPNTVPLTAEAPEKQQLQVAQQQQVEQQTTEQHQLQSHWQHLYGHSAQHDALDPLAANGGQPPPHDTMAANSTLYSAEQGTLDDNVAAAAAGRPGGQQQQQQQQPAVQSVAYSSGYPPADAGLPVANGGGHPPPPVANADKDFSGGGANGQVGHAVSQIGSTVSGYSGTESILVSNHTQTRSSDGAVSKLSAVENGNGTQEEVG